MRKNLEKTDRDHLWNWSKFDHLNHYTGRAAGQGTINLCHRQLAMKKGFLSAAGEKKKKKKEEEELPAPALENQCPQSAPSGELLQPQEASAVSAVAASTATATEGSIKSNSVFISQRLTRLIDESSSRHLRLRDAGREGRGVELCKDVSPGDVLIQAECFGTVVAEEFQAELCSR